MADHTKMLYAPQDDSDSDGERAHEPIEAEPVPCTTSTTGMALAVIVRDSQRLVNSKGCCDSLLRLTRLFISLIIVALALSLQLFVVMETKRLVTPTAVDDQRNVYSVFEEAMYTDPNGTLHAHKNEHGYWRGEDGYLIRSNWDNLPEEDQELACGIPLTQPFFMVTLLVIWTLTVINNLGQNLSMLLRVLLMNNVMEVADMTERDETGGMTVTGLTPFLKLTMTCIILLPVGVAIYLLWLGCRWLTATSGFGEVVLNAVALEFVLLLPELLFRALLPERTKMETELTSLKPAFPRMTVDITVTITPLVYLLSAVIFVLLYFYLFQGVLPNYKWDVHASCDHWFFELQKKVG